MRRVIRENGSVAFEYGGDGASELRGLCTSSAEISRLVEIPRTRLFSEVVGGRQEYANRSTAARPVRIVVVL